MDVRPVQQPRQRLGPITRPPIPELWRTPTAAWTCWWREWFRRHHHRRGPLSEGAEPRFFFSFIRLVAVEPAESPVPSAAGRPHKIQGIGAGFVPGTLDMGVVDEVVAVTGDEAMPPPGSWPVPRGCWPGCPPARRLHAARILAQRPDMRGKTIAVVLPDTGERYLSRAVCVNRARWTQSGDGSGRRRFARGRSHIMYGAGPPGRHGRGSDSAGASFSAGPPGSGFESTGTPPPEMPRKSATSWWVSRIVRHPPPSSVPYGSDTESRN